MSHIAINFDPTTDAIEDVLEDVHSIFAGFGGAAHVGNASDAQASGGTPADADADGLRWDARIHSTPASRTTKGIWRAKRGVQATLVAQVRAEQAAMPQAVTGIAPPAAAALTPPAATALTPPATLAAPAALTPPATLQPSKYQQLATLISNNLHSAANPAGRINDTWVVNTLMSWGVPGGQLQNAANLPDAQLQSFIDGITTALGV